MGLEYERKFSATAAQLETLLGRYPEAAVISMETTYYDTPRRELSARRWTLRRRLENGVSVCALKTPGKGRGRGEWEVSCDDIVRAPELLAARGAPEELTALTQQGVIPTCGARFTRRACPVWAGDSLLELAMDEGVLLGGGRELPFREVEIELKQGDPAAADGFAHELARALGLREEHRSKFRRASALEQGEPV